MDASHIAKRYIFTLAENRSSLIGFYQQGSSVSGLRDKFSDYDFIVVWKSRIPSISARKSKLIKLGCRFYDFRNAPSVKKSIEAFRYGTNIINIAHIKANDFFNFYKELHNLSSFKVGALVRLSGLSKSKILFDPEGKITNYKQEVKNTERIKDTYKKYVKNGLEHDLRMLTVSTERKGSANYIGYLYDILESLNTLIALNNGKYPGSMKWFEVMNDNELGKLMMDLGKRIDKRKVTKTILEIAQNLDFKPSIKTKA